MRFYITLVLFIFLLAIAFVFGSQNEQVFSLNYLIARTEITVAAAVSLFTLLGFTLGILFSLIWKLKNTLRFKNTNKTK